MAVPPDTATDDAALDRARGLLKERFGHNDFLPGQADALRSVLAGRNVLAVMPTGSGKSLLYQLPALIEPGLTLVVSPLISLMKDQVDELVSRRIAATFINSSLSHAEQRARIDRCERGEVRLLYVAPERFQSAAFVEMLRRAQVARMAVDEAHCISEWGHDFRPDYRRLKQFREVMGGPRVSALTATATPRVQRDIVQSLGLAPEEVDVHVHGFDRPNLVLSVVQTHREEQKTDFVRRFLDQEPGSGIVYAGTRRSTEQLAKAVSPVEGGIAVYHGGMESEDRDKAQDAFMTGRARLAVATVAFGMGIDKADVRFVIHYHYPGSVEQYYQEIGRAGRDGEPSQCILLYSPGDRGLREFLIDLSYPRREIVESVYDALWRVHDNPIRLTYKEIAATCRADVKDGQVGASVRLLDAAGMTKALAGDAMIGVAFARPGAAIMDQVRGPMQRRTFEALSVAADLETPGRYEVGLGTLCSAAELTPDQVRRALTQLAQAGHIDYDPPFRGRGIEKRVDPAPPFDDVPIDWDHQTRLRRAEEEKLAAMEAYIRTPQCRRRFIVQYFGERTNLTCGTCDRCAAGGGDAQVAGGGVLERAPDIALPVVVCISALRFPLGANRVAQVVTGSKQAQLLEWGLHRNPAYGRAAGTQDQVKRVIVGLLNEGFLRHTGPPDRPVLELTDRGAAAAADAVLTEGPAPPATTAQAPSRGEAPEDDEIRLAVLRCVADLPSPVGVGKVAAILGGSQGQWIEESGAHRLSVFGTIDTTQKHIREVIQSMLRRKLLHRDRRKRYPVLDITEAGRALLDEAAPSPEPAADEIAPFEEPVTPPVDEGPAATAPPPGKADSLSPTAQSDGAALIDRHVAALLAADPTDTANGIKALRAFHPEAVTESLLARFESASDILVRARIVSAVGALGERHGLDFLIRCARDEAPALRRLAARAIRDAGVRLSAASTDLAAALDRAREALREIDRVPE